MNLSKEVKIGLFVVVAITMFVFGYNFLKGRNIFKSQQVIYAVYDNINGLQESSPVKLNGLQIGRVLKTRLLTGQGGKILVELSINNSELKIPANSVATIISADFLGAKAVELEIGNSSVFLRNKDTIASIVAYSLADEMGTEMVNLKNKAEHLITSIDSIVGTMKDVFNLKTRENLVESFAGINNTINSLEKTSLGIENMVISEKEKVVNILKNVESISSNLQANNRTLSKVINNFDIISDSIAKSNITSTVNNVSTTLAQTTILLERINKGEGSVGLFFKNDSLYRNLTAASIDLDKLIQDVKANPSKYINFSVFGRKDKTKQSE